MTEFNLSEKIVQSKEVDVHNALLLHNVHFIMKDDVKEFIKLLKEYIDGAVFVDVNDYDKWLKKEIDKLAGKDLI